MGTVISIILVIFIASYFAINIAYLDLLKSINEQLVAQKEAMKKYLELYEQYNRKEKK
jgi:hypothetical protein